MSKKTILMFYTLLFFLAATAQADDNKEGAKNPWEELLNWPAQTTVSTGQALGDTIFNLGDIRVSGSRLKTAKSEVVSTDAPQSITVIPQSAIEESASYSTPELLSYAEGVTYTDELGQGSTARVDLRAFGGEAKQALVLFNGIRAVEPFDNSMTWSLYPTEFLKEVEIQRGGASTIYGEGALSGVICLETKEPTQDWHVATENSFGSFRSVKDFVEASGTLPAGRQAVSGVGVYVAGKYFTSDGYRQNSDQEGASGILTTTAPLSEFINTKNTFFYSQNNTGIAGPLLQQEVEENRRQKDPDGQFGDKFEDTLIQDSVQVSYFAEPIGVEFTDLIGYRSRQQDSVQSFGGAFPGTSLNDIGTESFSNVVQGSGHFEYGIWKSETSLGMEWSIDDIHNPFTFDDKTFGPFSTDRAIDRRFLGYFIQNKSRFWDNWILESGARWDDIDWNIYDLFSPRLQKRKAADHLSPKIALEYKIADALSVFGGVSESFKVPDSNTLIFETPNIFAPNPNVDPSVALHREIGVRYAHPRLGSLRATYFNIETKKEILFNDISNTNENFDTRRQGVELAGEWSWGRGIQTFARYSWSKAEFDNGVFDGKDVPLVPQSKWAAGVVYKPDQSWSFSTQASGVSDQFALNDFNNIFPSENYWTWDARVAYRVRNGEIFLKAQNLLGESYSSFVTSNGVDVLNFNPAPRQTVELGFRLEI